MEFNQRPKSNLEFLLDNKEYYEKLKKRQLSGYENSKKFSMLLKNKMSKTCFTEGIKNAKIIQKSKLRKKSYDSDEEEALKNHKELQQMLDIKKYDNFPNSDREDSDKSTRNVFLTTQPNSNYLDEKREFLKKKQEMENKILTYYRIYQNDEYSEFYNTVSTVNFISFKRQKKKPPLKKNINKIKVKYMKSIHKKAVNNEFDKLKANYSNEEFIKKPKDIERDEDFLFQISKEKEFMDKKFKKSTNYNYEFSTNKTNYGFNAENNRENQLKRKLKAIKKNIDGTINFEIREEEEFKEKGILKNKVVASKIREEDDNSNSASNELLKDFSKNNVIQYFDPLNSNLYQIQSKKNKLKAKHLRQLSDKIFNHDELGINKQKSIKSIISHTAYPEKLEVKNQNFTLPDYSKKIGFPYNSMKGNKYLKSNLNPILNTFSNQTKKDSTVKSKKNSVNSIRKTSNLNLNINTVNNEKTDFFSDLEFAKTGIY